ALAANAPYQRLYEKLPRAPYEYPLSSRRFMLMRLVNPPPNTAPISAVAKYSGSVRWGPNCRYDTVDWVAPGTSTKKIRPTMVRGGGSGGASGGAPDQPASRGESKYARTWSSVRAPTTNSR